MNCWNCNKPAQGVCILCGRAVCKNDAKRNPNILAVYDPKGEVPKVIMVEDALWCGLCNPIPDPVEMPELEGDAQK